MNRHIDTGRVIEEVRLRKCLWDASDIFYKNKDARLKAWNDIVIALFEDVQENEKNNLEKLIQQRWKTARDAFFRCKGSMRNTSSGSSAKKMKKYVYYDDLSFLHQTGVNIVIDSLSTNSDNSSSIIDTEDTSNRYTLENAEQRQLEQEQGSTQMPRPPKRRKRQPLQENSNFEKELLTLLRNQTPDIDNDDLAFFSSLGPVLKSFDLEQKLQFRSRVLAVAMDIQNIYPRANSSPTNYTTDNEAQGNDGTPSTYEEEYKPQMYHI